MYQHICVVRLILKPLLLCMCYMHYLVLYTGNCSLAPPVNGLRQVTSVSRWIKQLGRGVVSIVNALLVGQIEVTELCITLHGQTVRVISIDGRIAAVYFFSMQVNNSCGVTMAVCCTIYTM